MSETEGTTPAEQPAPSTEEQPTEPESQPAEPQAPEQAETGTGDEPAPQEGGGESAPAEEKQEEPAQGGEEQKQEEQPAGETPAAEGGEGEGETPAAGEGGEEEEGKKEEEAEPEKEEPIVITPEGNKYWLSKEDVLAKGVPENEVENFKTFYYKHGHSIQTWYEKLKDHTYQTEFITLSKEEIEALSVEGDPSEEQQQVLDGLKDRVNGAIELYGEEGAMVRIGGRSAKDAVLDRNEESFIAEVQDDVINNLEVEKQSANAYAIWKDEKHPGAFRRGLTKIRQSFRRSRPATAPKEKSKLEEEEKEGEEAAPKAEEAGEGGEAKPEGEEQPKEAGEAAGGAEVTVEADVEQGAGEEKPAEADKEPAPAAEPQPEEPTPAGESEPAEPKPTEEGEKKEGEGEGEKPAAQEEGEKKEGGEDGEIQKAEEGEGEKKEGEGEEEKQEGDEESQPKSKRSASRKKKSGEAPHHHHHPKSKHDNLDNQIMRAFLKSVGARYKVANGEEALQMLRKSGQIRRDLNQLKPFCGIEGVQFSMSVTKWDSQIPQYPGMDLRGFVYGNELRALSQYNDSAYFPNVDHYKHTIQIKVENFFKEHIQEPLNELENYVIDFFVSPEKIYVVRLNPFYTGTGACLFTWTEHAKVLTRGPFEFGIVTASKTAPEAYSSLQPFWSTMLESVLGKKKDEQRQSSSRGCVIL